jgi:hypothetical protein
MKAIVNHKLLVTLLFYESEGIDRTRVTFGQVRPCKPQPGATWHGPPSQTEICKPWLSCALIKADKRNNILHHS